MYMEIWVRLIGVLGVNLILSGDNALVIAMAARKLEGSNRRKAILWGSVGAVILRIIFVVIIIYLLLIPLLQAIGGLILMWIAWSLVQEDHDEQDRVQAGTSPWEAVRIIVVADAIMSLDNVIALVGVSGGNFLLLALGLATTVPLVVFGASLLSSLLNKFPILVYFGAGLLVYVAVEMIFSDELLRTYIGPLEDLRWITTAATISVFLTGAWLWSRHSRKRLHQ